MADNARSSSEGVAFPEGGDGRRSTTATGRAIFADSVRNVDPAIAARIEHTADWRGGYIGPLQGHRHGCCTQARRRADGLARRPGVGPSPFRLRPRRRAAAALGGHAPLGRARLRIGHRAGRHPARARALPPLPRTAPVRRRPAPADRPVGDGRHRRAGFRRGDDPAARQPGLDGPARRRHRRPRRRRRARTDAVTAAMGRTGPCGRPAATGHVAAPHRHHARNRGIAAHPHRPRRERPAAVRHRGLRASGGRRDRRRQGGCRPPDAHPGAAHVDRRDRAAVRSRDLRVRGRRSPRPAVDGRRRHRDRAPRPPWRHHPGLPRDAHRRVHGAHGRSRGVTSTLGRPRAERPHAEPAAAPQAVRAQLQRDVRRGRRHGVRHQRLPRAAAGPELRAGQATAAVARPGSPR